MPFVKLDCGILNSTLWFEREAREVFITALLMAEPLELTTPMPQIAIGSLDYTGWSVPPGWYGFVPAASVGILHQAQVSPEVGIPALTRLGEPEQSSRSKEFDGRRLVRVDGGFIVLNFMKYRDRDYTAAVRAARYRKRKQERAQAEAESHRDVTPSHRNITQAEAEAEYRDQIPVTKNKLDRKIDPVTTSKNGARAHAKTPIIGRNTHLDHAACDDTFSYCVPSAVHRKFADLLAPKYAGDRDAAKEALQAWYPTIWARIPADSIMGDAFKFWQVCFDEDFASAPPKKNKRMTTEELTEAVRADMKAAGELP